MYDDEAAAKALKAAWERWTVKLETVECCLRRARDQRTLPQWLEGDLGYCINQMDKAFRRLGVALAVAARRHEEEGGTLAPSLKQFLDLAGPTLLGGK